MVCCRLVGADSRVGRTTHAARHGKPQLEVALWITRAVTRARFQRLISASGSSGARSARSPSGPRRHNVDSHTARSLGRWDPRSRSLTDAKPLSRAFVLL